jgi:hypothetical protein
MPCSATKSACSTGSFRVPFLLLTVIDLIFNQSSFRSSTAIALPWCEAPHLCKRALSRTNLKPYRLPVDSFTSYPGWLRENYFNLYLFNIVKFCGLTGQEINWTPRICCTRSGKSCKAPGR